MHRGSFPAPAGRGKIVIDGRDLYTSDVTQRGSAPDRHAGLQRPNPFPDDVDRRERSRWKRLNGKRLGKATAEQIVEKALPAPNLCGQRSKTGLWPGMSLVWRPQQRLRSAPSPSSPRSLLMMRVRSALDPDSTSAIEDLDPGAQRELYDRHRDSTTCSRLPGSRDDCLFNPCGRRLPLVARRVWRNGQDLSNPDNPRPRLKHLGSIHDPWPQVSTRSLGRGAAIERVRDASRRWTAKILRQPHAIVERSEALRERSCLTVARELRELRVFVMRELKAP